MDRFFCQSLEGGFLDASESRHCLQVLRHQIGDRIEAFDGKGSVWQVKITSAAGKKVSFSKEHESFTPSAGRRMILVQAIPKGKAMEMILQKATELGVSQIIPILTERSVARVEDDRAEGKVEKWRETLVEAAKQCGQNWLPLISAPIRLPEFLGQPRPEAGKLIGSLQEERKELKTAIQQILERQPPVTEFLFMIGPEGDFTAAEVEAVRAEGYIPVSLGPLVLRSDTAAIYALSVLRYETLNADL